MINVIRDKSKLNSWKNTAAVLTWFKKLKNKRRKHFIVFDIDNFYPSITPELMSKALDWAEMYVNISEEERNIIMMSKKSFLYAGKTPWVKKGDKNFDIAMGAFDGAESCDLIGLFLLDQITNRVKEIEAGLFRDDGLAVADTTKRNVDKINTQIVSIMAEFGLKITSLPTQKAVKYLDVILDLENECFKPYNKTGNRPIYVNRQSNHPPAVTKNIPLSVNRRLSSISSAKGLFDETAPLYQAELKKAGYEHKLEFTEVDLEKRKRRPRRRLYFNPPYCMTVKTNVGQKFLNLIDKHFPRGSFLYPLINRTKVKLSYRCMPNMGMKINKHNAKILGEPFMDGKCNCRNPAECPLPGKCLTDQLVYRATVTAGTDVETYVGLTAGEFKTRYSKHKQDFKNQANRNSTTLSSHIWRLKEENKAHTVEFSVVGRATPFSPVSGRCNLCILEKFEIIFNSEKATLNSRRELFSACRHRWAALLTKKKRKTRPRGR